MPAVLPVVIKALGEARAAPSRRPDRLRPDDLGDVAEAENYNADVIRPLDKPLTGEGGIVVLRGNLVPDGAVHEAFGGDAGADAAHAAAPSCSRTSRTTTSASRIPLSTSTRAA